MGNRFKIGLFLSFSLIILVLAITQLITYIQLRQLGVDMLRLTTDTTESTNEESEMYYAPSLDGDNAPSQINLCSIWNEAMGAFIDMDCEAWQEMGTTGWYITTRGDTLITYCFNNTSPKATDCYLVSESVNHRNQSCHMIVRDQITVTRCQPLGNGRYLTLQGDETTLVCKDSRFPVAKECSKYITPN